MNKRLDRVVNGPSWTEVVFGALLSFALGVVIAVALLVLKPVVAVKQLPKETERDPKAVYYVEGSRLTSRATAAAGKRKDWVEGKSVTATEDEINSLVEAAASPNAKAADKKPGEKGAVARGDEMLATGTPNVRIRDGVMQIAVPVTVSVLGSAQNAIVQARGGFAKKGDAFVFEPTEFYLGSCPVQRLPFLAGYARKKLLAARVPADIALAWSKLANVEIDGNSLKLTMP
ncbi:MAG: hypothetical protein ABIR80_02485 [Opitutaceae bacterium]